MTGWTPLAPTALAAWLADWLESSPGLTRLALDGPDCAEPARLADALVTELRGRGRPAEHVPASGFWHDASIRLEHGHQDVEAYAEWLDAGALAREVLTPALERGALLPSLRDPVTNRSTRVPVHCVTETTVVVVSGTLLLGRGLAFDRSVHLQVSDSARARRTPPSEAWTLPALAEYDRSVCPAQLADVVVASNDPLRPAARRRPD